MRRHSSSLLGLCAATLLITGAAVAAAAQEVPRATVAGGYTYLKEQGPGDFDPETYPAGWLATASFRLTGRLSGVGEIGMNSRTNTFEESVRLLGVFGGARWDAWRSARAVVFAQGLMGVERFSEPGFSESGLAVQIGGGVDVPVWRSWLARVQADYRRASQTAGTFHEARLFIGAGVAIKRSQR